jgi:dephospho-CoA kinase
MPYSVGLTGGIGSGKSSAAGMFGELGAEVIDADAIAHELTRPGGAAIAPVRAAFGDAFIDSGGALDRARMRSLVFSDPGGKQRLEAILHPLIRVESERRAKAATSPYVVMMIPLLVESGGAKDNGRARFQRIAVVDCPEETQIARVTKRSNLPAAEVRAIMATQASRAQRLAAADDVIDNSGSLEMLRGRIKQLHRHYLELASLWKKSQS